MLCGVVGQPQIVAGQRMSEITGQSTGKPKLGHIQTETNARLSSRPFWCNKARLHLCALAFTLALAVAPSILWSFCHFKACRLVLGTCLNNHNFRTCSPLSSPTTMADFGDADDDALGSSRFTVTAKGFRRRHPELLAAFEADAAAGGDAGEQAKAAAAAVRDVAGGKGEGGRGSGGEGSRAEAQLGSVAQTMWLSVRAYELSW